MLAQDFSVAAPDHPTTARVYQGLGEVSLRQLAPADAQRYFESAVRVRTKFLGESHPHTVLSTSSLALAQAAARPLSAQPLLPRLQQYAFTVAALAAAQATPLDPASAGLPGLAPRAAASTLLNTATIQELLGCYPAAQQLAMQAHALLETVAPGGLLALQAKLRLARLDLALAHYPSAREWLGAAQQLVSAAVTGGSGAEAASLVDVAGPALVFPDSVWCSIEHARHHCTLSHFPEAFAAVAAADEGLAALGGEATQPTLQVFIYTYIYFYLHLFSM